MTLKKDTKKMDRKRFQIPSLLCSGCRHRNYRTSSRRQSILQLRHRKGGLKLLKLCGSLKQPCWVSQGHDLLVEYRPWITRARSWEYQRRACIWRGVHSLHIWFETLEQQCMDGRYRLVVSFQTLKMGLDKIEVWQCRWLDYFVLVDDVWT